MLKRIWESVFTGRDKAKELPTVVNYVWINKHKFVPAADGPLCGVPLHYIDKTLKNARQYPQARFKIWADFRLLDAPSRYFLASHVYISGTENVEICDLNDIPAYRDSSFFQDIPKERDAIWARVDLARLLVLRHCADTIDPAAASVFYYSDFDVEDVMLDCPVAQKALSRYGMFLGTTPPDNGKEGQIGDIENGFIGIHRNCCDTWLRRLIRCTSWDVRYGGSNGYDAFAWVISAWEIKNLLMLRRRSDYSGQRLKFMGYRIPDDPFYRDCGIN